MQKSIQNSRNKEDELFQKEEKKDRAGIRREKTKKKSEINPEGSIDNKNLIKEIISRGLGRQPSQ